MGASNRTGSDQRVSIRDSHVLSDESGQLARYEIDFHRKDGRTEPQTREVYERGDGAVVLLYDRDRGTVILTRQFRLPVHLAGVPAEMIEACAGLIDGEHPQSAIRREVEEETGYRIGDLDPVWTVFLAPDALTERLHVFTAPYTPEMRVSDGGGKDGEGEEIEVLELALSKALEMIDRGEICDAKTIILLQHAALKGLCRID